MAYQQSLKPHSQLFILTIIFLCLGCAARMNEVKEVENTSARIRQEVIRLNTPKEEGSLWVEGRSIGYFADIKARRVGDIVTIRIVENARAKKSANTKLGRESEIAGKFAGHDFTSLLKESKVGIDFSKGFEGGGQTSRSGNLEATITAFVTEVLPNGNMRIEGHKEVKVNNENQYMSVKGIVRPEDISTNNQVLSTSIADAKIEYSGKGLLSEKQWNGWISRMLDYIWPF